MKVVLLTSDCYISSNIAIHNLLKELKAKNADIEIAGILVANQFSLNKRSIKRTIGYFKKINPLFLIKNVVTNVYKQVAISFARVLLPNRKRNYYSIREMAEENDIEYKSVDSINSREAINFIKKHSPDILASCFLLEIVKKEVLSLPKNGAINVHPSLIQRHRGIFTSFWALMKKWKRSGATVHYMNEKIDDGDVIIQKKFFVHPSDSIHSIDKKAAALGGKLIVKALVKIKRNKVMPFRFKKVGQFFTSPTPSQVKNFYTKGHTLISRRDFFNV